MSSALIMTSPPAPTTRKTYLPANQKRWTRETQQHLPHQMSPRPSSELVSSLPLRPTQNKTTARPYPAPGFGTLSQPGGRQSRKKEAPPGPVEAAGRGDRRPRGPCCHQCHGAPVTALLTDCVQDERPLIENVNHRVSRAPDPGRPPGVDREDPLRRRR